MRTYTEEEKLGCGLSIVFAALVVAFFVGLGIGLWVG